MPFTNVGGVDIRDGRDTVSDMLTGMRFKLNAALRGRICVYIMNSQQSRDHRAMNELLKYETEKQHSCQNTEKV